VLLLFARGLECSIASNRYAVTRLTIGFLVYRALKARHKRLSASGIDIKVIDILWEVFAVAWFAKPSERFTVPEIESDQVDACLTLRCTGIEHVAIVNGGGIGYSKAQSDKGENIREVHC
jgi:hypothetical protein